MKTVSDFRASSNLIPNWSSVRLLSVPIVFMLIAILFVNPAYSQCAPSQNQAAFFVDANYGGECVVKDIGAYPWSGATGLPNDSITSVKVGSNVQAILCIDADYLGNCERLSSDDANLSDNAVRTYTTSIKVQPRGFLDCNPGSYEAAFYMHANYIAPCSLKQRGDYNWSGVTGLDNDSISSVRVGMNVEVILCSDANFDGFCEKIQQSDENLRNNRVRNDTVTSLRVRDKNTKDCPNGASQIAIFEHPNYVLPCSTLDIGVYPYSGSLGIRNDTLSSIRVGSEVQGELFQHREYRGKAERFLSDDSDLQNNRIGESTTSVVVRKRDTYDCDPGPNQVSFYQDANYFGKCVVKNLGEYPDTNAIGVDGISSVRIGPSTQACIHEDKNFLGDADLLTEHRPSLRGTLVRNDRTSSAKVQLPGASCVSQQPEGTNAIGHNRAQVFNCTSHEISIWSLRASGTWTPHGPIESQDNGQICPDQGALPLPIGLDDGILYVVRAIDLESCPNISDPNSLGCIVNEWFLLGDSDGQPANIVVH